MGVKVENAAQFPIDVRIDSLDTHIAKKIPDPENTLSDKLLKVPPKGIGEFTNSIIDLSNENLDDIVYGKIEATISYGRPGRLHHSLDQHLWLAMKFDKGQLVGVEQSMTKFVNV